MRLIKFALPDVQEEDIAAVTQVLRSGRLTEGPQVEAFEQEFAAFLHGDCYAIAVSSCWAALYLSWLALGMGPGDEVICPALTHVATAHAITMTGATPVFVDCDPQTGTVTAALIEPLITGRTRGICVMDYVGNPCDAVPILCLAEAHGLVVVEDAATACGALYSGKPIGWGAHCAAFSFYPAKHITTGEGGMFVTRHQWLADTVRKMRAFGITKNPVYDVPLLGANYRMSEMQAALGRGQLRRFPQALEKRRQNWRTLANRLIPMCPPDVQVITSDHGGKHTAAHAAYCVVMQLVGRIAGRRDILREHLKKAGIETSVYYPRAMPDLTCYRAPQPDDWWAYRHTREIVVSSLALPCYQQLTESDMVYIADQVEEGLPR